MSPINPTTTLGLDVPTNTLMSSHIFPTAPAQLTPPIAISTTLNAVFPTTVVSQPPLRPPTMAENLSKGHDTMLTVPSPNWLLPLGSDILNAARVMVKAPMQGLIVEMKVEVGDHVEEGQTLVVLESMKMETVLTADVDGVVRAIGGKNGEMVEEGKELFDIEVGLGLS